MTALETLRPYQREAAEAIAAQGRMGLFDDPGSGKTRTALAACEIRGLFDLGSANNVLVLATKTGAALTWLHEAELLVPDHVTIIDMVNGSIPQRNRRFMLDYAWEGSNAPVLVIGNHALMDSIDKLDYLAETTWQAVIIDESHKVLPTEHDFLTDRTKFQRGLAQLKLDTNPMLLAMSGTPDRGKLHYRYGTWAFLLPERFNEKPENQYSTWLRENFYINYKKIPLRRGGKVFWIDQAYPMGIKDAVKDSWITMEHAMTIRRTKAEIAPWLPPKQYLDVELPFPAALRRAYDVFLTEFVKEDDESAHSADTFRIRATQFAVGEFEKKDGKQAAPVEKGISPKRDWLIDWLETRGHGDKSSEAGSKVVIASQFSSVLRWLRQELHVPGIPSVLLDGSLSTRQRLDVQRSFQADGGPRIVLLNMSLGDSIDLDRADDLIFMDHVNDPDRTTQTEDRVHRVSRDHQVRIWRLISLGTVDEAILENAGHRYTRTREILDGSRGIDFERNILARLGIGAMA